MVPEQGGGTQGSARGAQADGDVDHGVGVRLFAWGGRGTGLLQRAVEMCEQSGGSLSLAGIPLRIDFLGIFDTVASVGLADSFPLPVDGHFDWVDGMMRVPPQVERCLHLVASHEIRASFPLNTGRDGKAYPGNVAEFVYPGAHSSIGGGYGPGEQGRSRRGTASLMSQLPLRQMYDAARGAGVLLVALDKMKPATRRDFDIDDALCKDFNRYLDISHVPAGRVETMLEQHMRYYRRYMAAIAKSDTESMQAANAQDRQDLKGGNQDFQRERIALETRETVAGHNDPRVGPRLSEREKLLLEDLRSPVEADVVTFLDNYVHDSHAGFYLAGPVTKYDKEQEIKRVKALVQSQLDGIGRLRPPNVSESMKASARERIRSGDGLNAWDRKVWKAANGAPFPLMTDSDQWDMLRGGDLVVAATTSTRREGAGYFRQRVVFSKS